MTFVRIAIKQAIARTTIALRPPTITDDGNNNNNHEEEEEEERRKKEDKDYRCD